VVVVVVLPFASPWRIVENMIFFGMFSSEGVNSIRLSSLDGDGGWL
jgi:hypothetical protein